MSKLPVENVLDLDKKAVLLIDALIEKYLFICNEGATIGRRIGIYSFIREELEEIAKFTELEVRKSSGGA